jgi:aminoglycoside phosphotransferase family enzyme/predicted kinase
MLDVSIDQRLVIDFLASPSTHGGAPVERIDTHTAVVVLAGARAYKLKRAVRFDYLDFSTRERRRTCCEAEVRLNQRTAPALYTGVLPVTEGAGGSLALGGNGDPLDWVVEMKRFPQEALLDRLAAAGGLDSSWMAPLAASIARLHHVAARRPEHGGRAGMAWVIEGNAAGFDEFGPGILDSSACHRVTSAARRELEARADLLEHRRAAGLVRECHGDLHLRNIVLIDGRPTLFDCVEFNDRISCTDVLYDLAFLLMDLWRRRLPHHANIVWNSYLAETGDFDGAALMPLFLSCRAAVRAKTSATAAKLQKDGARQGEWPQLARDHLAMAEALLGPPAPALIAIGGLSGSGKSMLARGLAPLVGSVPGAAVFRSDEIRKRLLGAPASERLGAEGYAPDVSRQVYGTLVDHAGRMVRAGQTSIADATFARPEERRAIERAAGEASVPFVGLWLDAPESTLIARVDARHGDASDADAHVVRRQVAEGIGAVSWHRLDASGPIEDVRQRAEAYLRSNVGRVLPFRPGDHP